MKLFTDELWVHLVEYFDRTAHMKLINSLPNKKCLDRAEMKAFADNKIKLANMMMFAIVGKKK